MGVMIKAAEIDGAFDNGLFMFRLASWLLSPAVAALLRGVYEFIEPDLQLACFRF